MRSIAGHTLAGMLIAVLLVQYVLNRSGGATTDEYPARPIKLVVPFGPGGGSDTFARIIQAGINENGLLPQPFVIINRPGGSSTIGSRYVRDAKPDGYTLLLLHDALITAKYSGTVSYGPEVFEPVAGTGEIGLCVAVHEDSPYQTLNDLMDAAAEEPDEIVYGVNMGAPSHFLALRMENAQPGLKFRYTQAGDGTDRVQKLTGGHIQAATFSATELINFEGQGIRGLAIFSPERRESLPDLPTALEQGIDIEEVNSQYWWFPKDTPQERVDYMADVLRRAMQTDTVRDRLEELHIPARFLSGPAHNEYLKTRIESAQSVGKQESPDVPDIPTYVGCGLLACLLVIACGGKSAEQLPDKSSLRGAAARRAGMMLAAAVIYAAAMQFGAGFAWVTMTFILAIGLLLCDDRKRILLPLAETAVIVAFGVQYVLTQIVVTDLP